METNKIYNMDAIEGLKQLEDKSIDIIITDPPYGKMDGGFAKFLENKIKDSQNIKNFVEEMRKVFAC